jgi:uncharacterized small protein (DUF1192 family)
MKIVEHRCRSYCEICGKDLSERIRELEAEITRLTALVKSHQCYQTKQGEK